MEPQGSMTAWDIWQEFKPIVGPLIQAIVVLIVGIATWFYQYQQSQTAKLKLFADIHDKRYRAITAFMAALDKTTFDLSQIKEPESRIGQNEIFINNNSERSRLIQEVVWLFGPDVRKLAWEAFHINTDVNNRIWSGLKADGKLGDGDYEVARQWRVKYQELCNAARPYLYMGDIKRGIKAAMPEPLDVEELLKSLKEDDSTE